MKTLTIQALIQQQWRDIATLQLLSPEKGIASPSRLGYEFEYSIKWLDCNNEHACSLVLPVQIMIEHEADRLIGLQQRLEARGVPERILEVIQAKWLETKLTRWGLL